MQNIITIDGPSASGKSSLSRELARKMKWRWVSTGAFYRAIGYLAKIKGVDPQNEQEVLKLIDPNKIKILSDPIQTRVIYEDKEISYQEIYSTENGKRASDLSVFPSVRAAVLDLQRSCYQEPGLIAEGRDCGTVIFPQAQLKIFLEADSSKRISRRIKEENGEKVQEVKKSLKERDLQDTTRKAAPLKKADGAITVDTSDLSLEEVVKQVYGYAKSTFSL